jgi:hypothetical protein
MRSVWPFAVAIFLWASSAHAAPIHTITIEWEGVLNSVEEWDPAQQDYVSRDVNVAATGRLLFDMAVISGSPYFSENRTSESVAFDWADAPVGWNVAIDDLTLQRKADDVFPNQLISCAAWGSLYARADSLEFSGSEDPQEALLRLWDASLGLVSNGEIKAASGLTGNLAFSNWGSWQDIDGNVGFDVGITAATVTILNAIPEPGAALLFCAGTFLVGAALRRR